MGGFLISDIDISENEFKEYYLKDITEDRIYLSRHALLRLDRKQFTEEWFKYFMTKYIPYKVEKLDQGKFKIYYNDPDTKGKTKIIIVAAPSKVEDGVVDIITLTTGVK